MAKGTAIRLVKVNFKAFDKEVFEFFPESFTIEEIKAKLETICNSFVITGLIFYDATELETKEYFYDNSTQYGEEKIKAETIINIK